MIQIKEWPSKYFKPEELLSPQSIQLYLRAGLVNLDVEALGVLEDLRVYIGESLYCNYSGLSLRGTRTAEENLLIPNAAKNSPHVLGKAFDISTKNMSNTDLYKHVLDFANITGRITGVGLYKTWVHIDTAWRKELTIWDKS